MKKTLKISLIVMILFLVLAVSNTAFAAVEVSTMEEFRKAVEGYKDENGQTVPPASEITLKEGFEMTGGSTLRGRESKVILTITDSLTINGNGKTLTGNGIRALFEMYADSGKDIVVTFNNVKLENNKAGNAHCIDFRTGGITLNLNGVTLDTSAAGPKTQPITVGGNFENVANINITDSTINAGTGGYPIISFNRVNINATNATLKGYCVLYLQGKYGYGEVANNSNGSANSKIKFVNSVLEATTANDGSSNHFTVFQVEDTGIEIDVVGSEISSNGAGHNNLVRERFIKDVDTSKANTITLTSSTYKNNSLSSKNNAFEVNGKEDPIANLANDNTKLIFNEGVKLNLYKVPARVLNNSGVKYTVLKSGDLYEIKKLNDPVVVDGTEKTINGDVTANGCDGAILAKNSANVIIDGGKIHGQLCTFDHTPEETVKPLCGYSMAVWAASKSTVTINGGTFTQDWDYVNDPTHDDLIYASGEGKIVITGGTFTSATPKWTLNCKDGSGSTITVKGGKFYKFNPATAGIKGSENYVGEGEVIVPDTHKVVPNGEWFEVVCAHTKLTEHPLKEATIVEEGCLPYFDCNECHKLFVDAAATKETTKEELVLDKLIEIKGTEAIVSDAAVLGAIQDAEDSAVVELPVLEASSAVKEVTVPVASIQAVAAEDKGLLIETSDVTVTLDAKTMDTVASESKDATNVTIEVTKEETKILNAAQKDAVKDKEVAVVISAKILADGKEISDFKGGKVTVEIPFKPAEGTTIADYKFIYIDDNGNVTEMPYKYFDGVVVVELEHFSEYAIARTVVAQGAPAPAPAPAPSAPEKDNTPKTGAMSFIGIIAVMAVVGLVVLKRD